MTDDFRDNRRATSADNQAAFSANAGQSLRMIREPSFTGLDVAAFVVTLIMVCGPLAMGAFRL